MHPRGRSCLVVISSPLSTANPPPNRLCNEGCFADSGRKTKLTEKTIEKTVPGDEIGNEIEAVADPITDDRPSNPDFAGASAAERPVLNGASGSAPAEVAEESLPEGTAEMPDGADAGPPGGSRSEARRVRRANRVKSDTRPRAAGVERGVDGDVGDGAGPEFVDAAGSTEEEEAEGEDPAPAAALAADAPAINLAGSGKRGARTVRRANKKQKAAEAAVEAADDNPALGALNRHLNTMMQQLSTAHRVIGRVAAERDALRQQLADLQGIPVEEIVVSTIGASPEQSTSSSKPTPPDDPAQKSAIARLNYFGGDDYAVMKKRRQTFALGILVVLVVLWLAARMGAIQIPANMSRESLTNIPLIGELVTFFLAGWVLFRVVRVSSKGVRWVFPSEDQRQRRR
jgi:hypothetical protein